MPIHVFWGEDDFAIEKEVYLLRDRLLDPLWASFNYTVLSSDDTNAPIQALNLVMTPPFGAGGRLVWLPNSTICQQCPESLLSELERTLPVVAPNSHLLLTSSNKPDERLKSTKLLKKFADFREFSLVPPWKTEVLIQSAKQAAQNVGVKLTVGGMEMLVEAVGNDTRLLYNELEKLRLYAEGNTKPLDTDIVAQLVKNTTQSSLKLAEAIRTGDTVRALTMLTDLVNANEPPLRIVATLIGQFRTWLWVKLMMDSGERNVQAIAKAAEIANFNRVYILQKDVRSISVKQLIACLPLLLDLEVSLKQGNAETSVLQTKVIELCQVCQGK